MKHKKNIILVQGHPVVRKKLAKVLNTTRDLAVSGQAETVFEAIDLLAYAKTDAAIVNLSLDASVGLETIQKLRAKYPALPIIASVLHNRELLEEKALEAGASSCITGKDVDVAIRRALRGRPGNAWKRQQTEFDVENPCPFTIPLAFVQPIQPAFAY